MQEKALPQENQIRSDQDQPNLPQHIAIVMDGNGRWAKKRFLPRVFGHRAGVEAVRRVVKYCASKQIKVLSIFAFSSENWRRPEQEVGYLMNLFLTGLEREIQLLHENNVRVRFIGNRANFDEKLIAKIAEAEEKPRHNTGLTFLIAVDYGGQWDICEAVRRIANEVEAGKLKSDEVTSRTIANYLSFADLPNPDLFIRTSGERRISNFMLWQLAYAELYFTDVLWPDFDEKELDNALFDYANRERRFGLSGEQLNERHDAS